MEKRGRGVEGDWFGAMVHHPSRGPIHVRFTREKESYKGTWDFPTVSRGVGKRGQFRATRFANYLNVHIKTRPLTNVQCQLVILESNNEMMITGIIPLEGADIPFTTVTLFRHRHADLEMPGICPIIEFRPRKI